MTSDGKIPPSKGGSILQAIGISAIFLFFLSDYLNNSTVPACIKSIGRYGTTHTMCGIQAQLVIGILGLISAYLWFHIIKDDFKSD